MSTNYFSDQETEVLRKLADALLHETRRHLSVDEVVHRADQYVESIDAPEKDNIGLALRFLDRFAPRIAGFRPPFTQLYRSDRRQVLDRMAHRQTLRPLVRMLKLLVVFPYYTEETVRRAIGFIDFESRDRFPYLDTTPAVHRDPNDDYGKDCSSDSLRSHYDAIVIGSGAGGSMVAYELARAGMSVLILERGIRRDPGEFSQNEFEMIPQLYKFGGVQTTQDSGMAFLQGATVGGSTVINNAIWLRAELDRILPDWSSRSADFSAADFIDAYEHVERLVSVQPIPRAICNAPTDKFLDGSSALGLDAFTLDHNREECIGCGWCNYGCKYNRKTSALVTLIPWAERRGALVIDQCEDVRIRRRMDRVRSVEFTRQRVRHRVSADRFVVACGSIGSSDLLLRSNINPRNRVGRNFHALGGCTVSAVFPDRLDGFDMVGLTSLVEASNDYVTESFFSPPGSFAVSMGGWYETHADRMENYANFAQAGVMTAPNPVGRISLDVRRRTRINLEFGQWEVDQIKAGIKTLANIFFEAGASRVFPGTFFDIVFDNPGEIDSKLAAVRSAQDLVLGSAHPQGGNAIGDSNQNAVVDMEFRVHGMRNLFVADASLFPSNIWANCQATVMAIAKLAADSIVRS